MKNRADKVKPVGSGFCLGIRSTSAYAYARYDKKVVRSVMFYGGTVKTLPYGLADCHTDQGCVATAWSVS